VFETVKKWRERLRKHRVFGPEFFKLGNEFC